MCVCVYCCVSGVRHYTPNTKPSALDPGPKPYSYCCVDGMADVGVDREAPYPGPKP